MMMGALLLQQIDAQSLVLILNIGVVLAWGSQNKGRVLQGIGLSYDVLSPHCHPIRSAIVPKEIAMLV
jgi:hypothetical protein